MSVTPTMVILISLNLYICAIMMRIVTTNFSCTYSSCMDFTEQQLHAVYYYILVLSISLVYPVLFLEHYHYLKRFGLLGPAKHLA